MQSSLNKVEGNRHLIRCNCILTQHMNKKDPPFFHFLVFSVVEDDKVKPRIVQCPACGVLHRVTDIGRSTVLTGREDSKAVVTIDDVKAGLPQNLVKLMESHDLDQSQWEQAGFIVDNERWGDFVVLSSEVLDGVKCGKYVRIIGKELYKVESFEVEL